MIAYASRTGTRSTLQTFAARGWRILVSAKGVLRSEGFAYCLDNGAWTSHVKGEPFDSKAFLRAVALLGARADFIVAPDIVEGGAESLKLSIAWLRWLRGRNDQILIPAQDGMRPADLDRLVGPSVGVFLGGSTDWKVSTMGAWGRFCRSRGCYFHVGRVNTARRIAHCIQAGADSFDGSGPSKFPSEIPRLDNARRQLGLWSSTNDRGGPRG